MAINDYLTSSLISKEAVALFSTQNSLIATGYRKYENMFEGGTYAPGQTVNVREDNFFQVQRGDSVTAQAIVEDSQPLTILPLFSVPVRYKPTDLQREMVDFSAEVLEPAVRALVAEMNAEIWRNSLTQVPLWAGSAASNLNSYNSIDQFNPIMTNIGMDKAYKRYMCLNPTQASQLRSANSLQNSFLDTLNKDITMDARIGRLAGFDMMEDSEMGLFLAGTHAAAGNITVKTTVSTGNTIVLTGLSGGATFKIGDVISIAGITSVNNVRQASTGDARGFTVQADATEAGSDVTLTVFPAIDFVVPRQKLSSATSTIPATSIVTVVGDHTVNLAYTERGLLCAIPPLAPLDSPDSKVSTDKKFGVSIRISKSAEVLDNMNILRLDAQMATRWTFNQAIRVVSV